MDTTPESTEAPETTEGTETVANQSLSDIAEQLSTTEEEPAPETEKPTDNDFVGLLEHELRALTVGEGEPVVGEPLLNVKVPLKVAGEVVEVPLKEVLAGYQRREDYTRKTQELARQREQIKAEQEALMASLQKSGILGNLTEVAEGETPELDPLDPDSLAKYIERATALKLKQLIEPQYRALQEQKARAEAEAFIDSHKEFSDDEFRAEVATVMQERDLDLEDAYLIVVGKRAAQRKEEERRRAAERRSSAKAMSSGTPIRGRATPPPEVVRQGLSAVARWLDEHE